MSHIFVSYAREDVKVVQRLHEELTKQSRETWIDWESIRPSEEWWTRIRGGIEAAQALLFVINPDSVASRVCNDELAHASAEVARLTDETVAVRKLVRVDREI